MKRASVALVEYPSSEEEEETPVNEQPKQKKRFKGLLDFLPETDQIHAGNYHPCPRR